MQSSPWTADDRALMLAWRTYQDGLCSGCGHPQATAWHPDNEDGGFVLVEEITCQGCTAAQEPDKDTGIRKPVTYPVVLDLRDYEQHPLPPMPAVSSTPTKHVT